MERYCSCSWSKTAVRWLVWAALILTLRVGCYSQTAPPDAWTKSAAEVVGWFETKDDHGWGVVAGDFDCNGISAGVLQWNVGRKTLNSLIYKFSNETLDRFMPTYGRVLRERMKQGSALKYVQSLQTYKNFQSCNGNKRRPSWTENGPSLRDELSALLRSDEGKVIQIAAADHTAREAWKVASQWSLAKRGAVTPTFREFVFFFDTLNFNGRLFKIASYQRVSKFRKSLGDEPAYDQMLNYLAMEHANQYQVEDAIHNVEVWRKKIPTLDDLELLLSGYLEGKNITKKDSIPFRLITIARRGTIVFNDGYVNKQRKSFDQLSQSPPGQR